MNCMTGFSVRCRRLDRRNILSSVLAAAVLPLVFARAGSTAEQVNDPDRPPLPAFGPSYRQQVSLESKEKPGTIIISTAEKALYLVNPGSEAFRYRISIGREGFGWTGTVYVGSKREWPDWRPPSAMLSRQPDLPDLVPPGPYNPLGARALYLFRNGKDTLYRIHGTNDPDGVGFDGTSGCFRLTNTDIMDLYRRVRIGTKVIVK